MKKKKNKFKPSGGPFIIINKFPINPRNISIHLCYKPTKQLLLLPESICYSEDKVNTPSVEEFYLRLSKLFDNPESKTQKNDIDRIKNIVKCSSINIIDFELVQ